MKKILFAFEFRGRVVPGNTETHLRATSTGHSVRIESSISAASVGGTVEQIEGEPAEFESEVMVTGETSFQESGIIRFGAGPNRIHFSTVGHGHIAVAAEKGFKQGAVTWKIDHGDGQFSGAAGLITSNFLVSDSGEVTDYQFGLLFVKE